MLTNEMGMLIAALAAGVVVGIAAAICLTKWAAGEKSELGRHAKGGHDRAGEHESRWCDELRRALWSGY